MRKNLLESQKQLLKIKQTGISQAIKSLDALQMDYNRTIRQIAEELEIPKEEIKGWQFKTDYFEMITKEKK